MFLKHKVIDGIKVGKIDEERWDSWGVGKD
jgi:hypothetical protein